MLTGDMLRRSAQRFPDKIAIIRDDVRLTYRELDADANRFAHALLGTARVKGAKVAIVSRNLPEYGVVFFGAARSGLVLVNISILYAPDELEYVLNKSDAEILVFDAHFAEKVKAVAPRCPKIEHLVSVGATVPGTVPFADFIRDQPTSIPNVEMDERDPFCMTYTGGTTGRPKGVLCNHRAREVTAHTVAFEEALDERDVVAIVTPLFHVAALNIMFQPAILVGATCTFVTPWSPEKFMETVARDKVTANFMVPTQANQLISHPQFDAGKLATWRKVSFAGAPMPDWVQSELKKRLPDLRLTQIYGQSEMGVLTSLRDWYLPAKLGAVGRQAFNVDVALFSANGERVGPGVLGEIGSRGDNLMTEYYDEPEQTAAFFKLGNGWGLTGDVGIMDTDGFITLVDRAKDMLISGGENVYPKEIEDILYRLDAVSECAVFGVPDDKWGELPAAYIQLKSDARLTEHEVVTHCTRHLAEFKRPRVVKFVKDFPKTPIGKIQKNLLKEPYWKGRTKHI
ncbi:MAG: acyl--CoA ligase [Pseudomonadota bacterium]|nr:acyl--CoA ligase [Pseudomonadota bacterium]